MADRITVYYDYTCPYAYRAMRWLGQAQAAGRALELTWKTFSLKEVNRGGKPSIFDQPPSDSIGIVALELAQAAQAADAAIFARFHAAVYEAMQGASRRTLTLDDLLGLAAEAGLDAARFREERAAGRWLKLVAHDHREGLAEWNVFGTPVLVFDERQARFLKLAAVPATAAKAAALYDTLRVLVKQHPELVEIKDPA